MDHSIIIKLLCIIVCESMVSARYVRAINNTSEYLPAIICDKLSSVTLNLQDCVNLGRTSSGAGGSFVFGVTSVETLVAERCSTMSEIKTCVTSKVESCQNKDAIMTAFLDTYAMCDNGQPLLWITEWFDANRELQIQPSCMEEIGQLMSSELQICQQPEWASATFYFDMLTSNFDDGIVLTHRFFSSVLNCGLKTVKKWGSVIDMSPLCGDVTWNTLATLAALQNGLSGELIFNLLLDAVHLSELQAISSL